MPIKYRIGIPARSQEKRSGLLESFREIREIKVPVERGRVIRFIIQANAPLIPHQGHGGCGRAFGQKSQIPIAARHVVSAGRGNAMQESRVPYS